MANVIDRWHKSRPAKGEPECSEHKGEVRASGHGKGKRWQVRYRDPQGEQRAQNFDRRVDAEALAATVDADIRRGTYIDPNAGKIVLQTYAEQWIAGVTAGRSSALAPASPRRPAVHRRRRKIPPCARNVHWRPDAALSR